MNRLIADAPEAASDIPRPQLSLEGELRQVINRHSAETGSDTPDFILAQYLIGCLNLFDSAVGKRESWYGRDLKPVDSMTPQPPPPKLTRVRWIEEEDLIIKGPEA